MADVKEDSDDGISGAAKPFQYNIRGVVKCDYKRSQYDPEVMIEGINNYMVGPVRGTHDEASEISNQAARELREYLVERAKEWMVTRGHKVAKP
jgi:hypothetical protein